MGSTCSTYGEIRNAYKTTDLTTSTTLTTQVQRTIESYWGGAISSWTKLVPSFMKISQLIQMLLRGANMLIAQATLSHFATKRSFKPNVVNKCN
jgi:hypothetical protein